VRECESARVRECVCVREREDGALDGVALDQPRPHLWDMGSTVFMASGFGFGRERERRERGEREREREREKRRSRRGRFDQPRPHVEFGVEVESSELRVPG